MSDLDGFFLIEEFSNIEVDVVETASGTVTVPTRSQTHDNGRRQAIDAGYVLGWSEWPVDAPDQAVRRRGMVECLAPNAKSVWVLPDERRDGEGMFVVVRGVTANDADDAYRIVGGPGDYRSTDRWQRPRTLLPRAWRRTHTGRHGSFDDLHADRACIGFPRNDVVAGPPVEVEDCYVFDGVLHPMSNRPVRPNGELVPVCYRCMRRRLPA